MAGGAGMGGIMRRPKSLVLDRAAWHDMRVPPDGLCSLDLRTRRHPGGRSGRRAWRSC